MSRAWFSQLGALALALAILVMAAEPAAAQRRGGFRGGGYYPGGWGGGYYPGAGYGYRWGGYPAWGYGYYGGYPRGYWDAYRYPTEVYTYPGPVSGFSTAFYSPPAVPSMPPNAVDIRVEVPANAEIWFDGDKTTQTGSEREFVSPPLEPNKEYTYNIRAHWMENGKPVDQTRNVTVHAGDRLTVDFRQPAATGATTSSAPGNLPAPTTASTTPPPSEKPVP